MIASADMMVVALVFSLALAVFSPLLTLRVRGKRSSTVALALALLTLSLVLQILVFFILDFAMAASRSLFFFGAFLLLGTALSMAVSRHFHSRVSFALGTVFAAGLTVVCFVDWSPVKPYKRFFEAVHEGMGKTEVMSALHREFPEGGRFPVPVLSSERSDQLMFFLDPNQGAYNAEGVFLKLENSKVISKVYSPD